MCAEINDVAVAACERGVQSHRRIKLHAVSRIELAGCRRTFITADELPRLSAVEREARADVARTIEKGLVHHARIRLVNQGKTTVTTRNLVPFHRTSMSERSVVLRATNQDVRISRMQRNGLKLREM